MIVFDLECLNGHVFEGWFEDRQDLENQQQQGLLQCPVCETFSVEPRLSPIAIKTSCSSSQTQSLQASQDALAEFTQKVSEFVEKNYEDVGTSFTKEALKMHYGSTQHRNIRGTTTREEEKTLAKEGVPVFKVPLMKNKNEDLN